MATSELTANLGAVFTSRKSYVATLDPGTTNSSSATHFYWRENQHLCIDGKQVFTGPGVSVNQISVGIPSGLTIDTNYLPGGTGTTNQTTSNLGYGYWFAQGVGWYFINPIFNNTTSFLLIMNGQVMQISQIGAGDGINYTVKVPIVGWD